VRGRHREIAILTVTFLAAPACSEKAIEDPVPPTTPQLTIAYTTQEKITVMRPGGRDITFRNATIGQSRSGSPAGLSWSRNGRYVTWSTAQPNLVAAADIKTGQIRTWPCSCTNGAFAGNRLVTLDPESGTLLDLPLDGRPPTRTRLRGALTESGDSSPQIIGSDGTGILVKTETGAKGWRLFRVALTGVSTRIAASLPRRWTGEAAARPDGTTAFGLSSNGTSCGAPDRIAVVSAKRGSARVLDFPESPTRRILLRSGWGADGRLYASLAKWPPCSGKPGGVTDKGEIWVLDGTSWRYTGVRMLGFLPVSPDTLVGVRGTQQLTSESAKQTNELVVTGPSRTTRVIGRQVLTYAVSPKSMSSFTGRNAHLPARPAAPPSTPSTPVLGLPWAPNQEGYGQVRPGRVYMGGDPTGLYTNVVWHSWGGPTATADATGIHAPGTVADGTPEPARVVAFKLGYCRGTYAYRAMASYFPRLGEKFDPKKYIDVCTGDYVGF
jgi:hypothetical protein